MNSAKSTPQDPGHGRDRPLVIDLDGPSAHPPAESLYEEAPPEEAIFEAGSESVVDEDDEDADGLPKRAVRNEDGTVTLPLRYPVELQIRSAKAGTTRAERFAELTFHRLVGADLRAINATAEDSRAIVMLAKSTRLRETVAGAVFDRMDGADIADATKIIGFFIEPGRRTGR